MPFHTVKESTVAKWGIGVSIIGSLMAIALLWQLDTGLRDLHQETAEDCCPEGWVSMHWDLDTFRVQCIDGTGVVINKGGGNE
jgi:hypothetical protein